MVQAHLHALVQADVALGAVEAAHMELSLAQIPHGVGDSEHEVTRAAPRAKHPHEVLLAVKLTEFSEAAAV